MTSRPFDRGRSKSVRRLLAAALTLSMGYAFGAFTMGGCGGPQGGFAPPADGQLPERVVAKLTDCSKRGPTALQPEKHTVSFDVFMDSDGHVEQVALRDSTFHLDEVEACMEDALQALSARAADASLRRREPGTPTPISPETRGLFAQPVAIPAGAAQAILVVGFLTVAVLVYFQVVHNTKTHKPPPTQPDTAEPPRPDKDSTPEPSSESDPKTTGPTPPIPPEPPKPPKPKPRCDEVYPEVVNCFYIQQAKYPSRQAALDALIRSLPTDRQKRPFRTNGTEGAKAGKGLDHTTYKSADGRTKITIGCYQQCCKNTVNGPELEKKMQCYEHNTAYLR